MRYVVGSLLTTYVRWVGSLTFVDWCRPLFLQAIQVVEGIPLMICARDAFWISIWVLVYTGVIVLLFAELIGAWSLFDMCRRMASVESWFASLRVWFYVIYVGLVYSGVFMLLGSEWSWLVYVRLGKHMVSLSFLSMYVYLSASMRNYYILLVCVWYEVIAIVSCVPFYMATFWLSICLQVLIFLLISVWIEGLLISVQSVLTCYFIWYIWYVVVWYFILVCSWSRVYSF